VTELVCGPGRLWRRGSRASAVAAVALLWICAVPAAASPPPAVPASGRLILSLDELQAIVGPPTLTRDGLGDGTRPWIDHSRDPKLSAPCRRAMNQDERFGTTWSNFATVGYTGPSNIGVRQTVAAYPDPVTAQRALHQLRTAEQQCRAQFPTDYGVAPAVTVLDPDTLLLQYPETVNGPGSADLVHRQGQLLIEVRAAHYSTDPTLARTVLAHMVQKMT
jgi:hypothetical protein